MKLNRMYQAVLGGRAATPAMCGLVMALASMAGGCTSSDSGTSDAGDAATADSTSADASSQDTSIPDSVIDTAKTDTATTDSGAPDTLSADTATSDATTSDVVAPDATSDATDAGSADTATSGDAAVNCGNAPYVPTNVTGSSPLVQTMVTISPNICPGSSVTVPSDGRTKATIGLPAGTNFYLKGTAPGLLPGLTAEYNFSQQLVGLDSGPIDLPLTAVTPWPPLSLAVLDPQFSALGCQEVFPPDAGAPFAPADAGVNCDAGPTDAAALTHGLIFVFVATQQADAGACSAGGAVVSVQGLTLGAAADFTVIYADASGTLGPANGATSITAAHPAAMIIVNDAAAHPLVQLLATKTGCSSSTTILPGFGQYFETGKAPVLPGAVTSMYLFLAP